MSGGAGVSGKPSKKRFLKTSSESIRQKGGRTFQEERRGDSKVQRGQQNSVFGEFQQRGIAESRALVGSGRRLSITWT